MPIVDYEARISGRFDCPTPASASPGQKRNHQLPAAHDVRRPHCKIDLIVGTRGARSDRTDWCLYRGHCPDSPVLLSADKTSLYASAAAATGMSLKRGVAITAAIAVGAVVGATGVSAVLGLFASIHYVHGSWLFAATAREALLAACASGAAVGLLTALSDWKDWSAAQRRFGTLREMSGVATRLRDGTTIATDATRAASFIRDGLGSDDWALQQAALELEAAQAWASPGPHTAEGLAAFEALLHAQTAPRQAA